MTFYKYCGDLGCNKFASSWAMSATWQHIGAPALYGVLCLELGAGTSGGKHLWEAQLLCGFNSEAACTKERCLGGHALQQLSWSSCSLLSAVRGLGYLVLPLTLLYIWSDPWLSSLSQQKNNLAERKEGAVEVSVSVSSWGTSLRDAVGTRGGLPVTSLRVVSPLMSPAKFIQNS